MSFIDVKIGASGYHINIDSIEYICASEYNFNTYYYLKFKLNEKTLLLTEKEYNNLMKQLDTASKINKENEQLIRAVEAMKLHVSLLPGGTEYLAAQEEFNNRKN